MKWTAKPTGDMTLSVVDEKGFQILKVDMLSYNTMKAGTDGAVLFRTMNDLSLLACFASKIYDITPESRLYGDDPISKLPWNVIVDHERRKIVIKNQEHRIADRIFRNQQVNLILMRLYQSFKKGYRR